MNGNSKEAEPLLLLSCSTSDGSINLNRKNLSNLLSPIENLPVAIISVIGPPKNGKSILFGYIIRHLVAAEQDELDWMDWENPDKEMTELKWPREKSPDGPGIWCYHRPFILCPDDSEKPQKIAVLLLYTQTSDRNDWITENPEVCALIGLNLRISSGIIFNVHKNLDEECISAIATYIKYALHCGSVAPQVKRGNSSRETVPPLQNASFSIRDWNFPSEFPYGVKGGRNFVKLEKLNANPAHCKESRKNRQLINGIFQNVSGGLLPFPGTNVISSSGFRGSIREMSMDFAKTLAEFIKQNVGIDQIPLKMEGAGNQVTGKKVKEMIEEYVDRAQNMDSVNLDTDRFLRKFRIKGTISIGEQKESIKPAMKAYADVWRKYEKPNKVLKERELREIQKKARKKALDILQKEVTGGNGEEDDDEYGGDDSDEENKPEVDKQVMKMLSERIVKRFKEIQTEQADKKMALMEQYKEDILQQYKELITMTFPPEGRKPLERIFQRESKTIMATLSAEFGEKIGESGDREQTEMHSLMDKLKEEEKIAYSKIFGPAENGEEEMEVDTYGSRETMFEDDGNRRTFSQSQRKQPASKFGFEVGSLTFNKSGMSFDNNSLSFSSRTSEISNEDHETMSVASWEEKETAKKTTKGKSKEEMKREEERLKVLAKALVERLAKLHATELDSHVENVSADLDRIHKEHVTEIMETFENEMSYGRERSEYGLYQDILKDELRVALSTAKSKRRRVSKTKEVEEKIVKSRIVGNFRSNLEEFLRDNKNASLAELEEESEKMKLGELEILQKQLGKNSAEIRNAEQEMSEIYEEIRDRLKINRRSETDTDLNSMIKDYKTQYTRRMKAIAFPDTKNNQLIRLHENLVGELVTELNAVSLAQEPISTKKKCEAQLQKALNEAFSDFKEKQELKQEHASGTVKVALREAKLFYCQEMEKRLASQEYMSRENLQQLHRRTCEAAKKKYPKTNQKEINMQLEIAFQKYLDENSMNANDDEPAIGIDLGTTYSCVSVYQKGKVIILPNAIGKYTTPSYVLIPPNGKDVVGEPAKLRAYENPEGTIFDAKRILGRKFDDAKLQDDMKLWPFTVVDGGRGVPMIEVNGKRLNPEVVSAKILTQLKLDAEKFLKRKITKAVITVPAYFTDGQKQATTDAGVMAGLEVLSILTEPVAAAMAYKLQYNTGDTGDGDRYILVFDLGGGTFDVAILKASKGKLDVLTVDGDTHLGGEDFDKNLMKHCAEEFKKQHNVDLFDGKDSPQKKVRDDVRRRLKRLQAVCEMQKIALTTSPSTDVTVDNICNGLDLDVTVSRPTFEKINGQLFDSTIRVVQNALKEAKLDKSQITDIVLVGGSTRIPKVQKLLQNFFPGKQLDKKINPDEAVAHGAGLMAAIRQGSVDKTNKNYYKIQDVTPMSIGVEVYGGGFSAIIPKNTKTPVMLKERYKTAHNNQTSVQITIYEGEDKIATKNKHLGDFYLNGIPPKKAGEENIDVEMLINDQGILHVTAKCSSTGTKSAVTVTENKQRMGKAAINKYLADVHI